MATKTLSTADTRRAELLDAAITAFAERGYYGTTTAEVAKLAGISQAYVFRLFPNKATLFVAVVDRCAELLREGFARGVARVKSADTSVVIDALKTSYLDLVEDKKLLRVLLHANCAAAEPDLRDAVRNCYAQQVEYIRSASGASDEQIRQFMADGLLSSVLLAIGADEVRAPWTRTLLGAARPKAGRTTKK